MSNVKFCDSCGTSLSLNDKFCHNCGQIQAVLMENESPATNENINQEPITDSKTDNPEPETAKTDTTSVWILPVYNLNQSQIIRRLL